MNDTLISLTTIPRRFNTCLPNVIRSIKSQTIKCKILINIPTKYKKWNDDIFIPEYLIDNDIIIFRTVKDYGPATKLLGAVEYLSKNNITNIRNIITIDDDMIYSDIHHIEKLNTMSNIFPEYIITYSGIKLGSFPYRYQNGLIYNNLGFVDVPAGFFGVVYPVSCLKQANNYLQDDFISTLPPGIFNDDDAFFGIVFSVANIPIYSCMGDIVLNVEPTNDGGSAVSEHVSKHRCDNESELFQFAVMKSFLPNKYTLNTTRH